ncbi:type II toxin-antitoxin system ParD family antitoxin [Acidisoma sp. 7E03]
MTDISISLPPELLRYIDARVSSGRNRSVSDVVGDALRLLERADAERAEARSHLRQAWDEGPTSGDAGEIDIEAVKSEARRALKRTG